MSNYLKAGKGLKNMFIATVGAIICQVLLVIPFPFVNSIAMVATMVFTILNLMGLWTVGEDIAECKKAFWFTILGWVVNSIANAANNLSATGTSPHPPPLPQTPPHTPPPPPPPPPPPAVPSSPTYFPEEALLSLQLLNYVCISACIRIKILWGQGIAAESGDRDGRLHSGQQLQSIVACVSQPWIPIYIIIWSTSCSIATIADTCGNGVLYDLLKTRLTSIWGI